MKAETRARRAEYARKRRAEWERSRADHRVPESEEEAAERRKAARAKLPRIRRRGAPDARALLAGEEEETP